MTFLVMARKAETIADLSVLLGNADFRTSVEELAAQRKRSGELEKHKALALLRRLSDEASELGSETERVFLARLLAAFVPESLSMIQTHLDSPRSEAHAELQFSVFVSLSDLPSLAWARDHLGSITTLLTQYLQRVDTDAAQAAWMAGDLLGDHWPLDLALPVLLELSVTATHPAGREGAIHGLSHAVVRASKRDQWRIIDALQRTAHGDKSREVRTAAEAALSVFRDL